MPSVHARRAGASLLELLFSLGMLCLLTALAAPGFEATLRAAAVRSATFELLAGLQQIRTQAILEGRPGRLCPVGPDGPDGDCLAPAAPAAGWRAELRTDSGWREVGGQTLPPGVLLRASRSPLSFSPDSVSASTGTLTICDQRGIALPRAIVVSQMGRARVTSLTMAECPA
jgi:type IV fimbrial biogenesis protein FimT